MNRIQFAALLTVELRRCLPLVARMVLVTGAAVGLFLLVGRGTPTNLTAVLVGMTVGYVMTAPTLMARDRVDGTLEFLRTLPTTTATVTSAKFVAAALTVLPGAVQIAIAFAWFAPSYFEGAAAAAAIAGVFLAALLALSLVAWALLAAMARFELKTLFTGPAIVLAVLLILVPTVLDRVAPDPAALAVRFFSSAQAPLILGLVGIAVFAAGAAASYAIAQDGIHRFRPQPDQMLP